jgi:hypothetical protein
MAGRKGDPFARYVARLLDAKILAAARAPAPVPASGS